jgi:hypothetical protein
MREELLQQDRRPRVCEPAAHQCANAVPGRGRYGPYAGLAFWLYVTKDWIREDASGGIAQIR